MSGTQKLVRVRSLANLEFSPRKPPVIKAAQFTVRLSKWLGRRLFGVLNESRHQLRLMKSRTGFTLRNALLRRRPLIVHVGDQTFLMAAEGAVAAEIWCGRYSEMRELEFIVRALRPGMTFLDVGANAGIYSIPAANKVQHGKVYAFEPSASTFDLLSKNAGLNGVNNLEAVRSAVGDYSGEATLQLNVAGKDGLNTIGKPVHEDSEIVGAEKVPMTTLDDFLRQRSVSHVDVMKVDVEGAELLVFRGAKGLLAKPDAPLILYESGILTRGHGYNPVEMMWLLEQTGYSFFNIDPIGGRIARFTNMQASDSMLVGAKFTHPYYPVLQELAR